MVAVVKKTSGMLIPSDPGVNTSRTGGGVSNWNSRPLVRMSTPVAGVPGGELGGAKLPIAKLPLLSGDSSSGTCVKIRVLVRARIGVKIRERASARARSRARTGV